jgi:hypothetical protein
LTGQPVVEIERVADDGSLTALDARVLNEADTLIIISSSGTPISGEWRMIGRVAGCSEMRLLNVEYLFAPDGQMKAIALLPGTTAANLKLEHDGLTYAAVGMAKLAPKDCKDTKFVDTKFIGYQATDSTNSVGSRPWTEEWTVRSCGVTGVVTMHFTPDATGTKISTNLNETRAVNSLNP